MNRWRQTRTFHCQSCQTEYLHDLAYKHRLFECPARPRVVKATEPMSPIIEPTSTMITEPTRLEQTTCGWRAGR